MIRRFVVVCCALLTTVTVPQAAPTVVAAAPFPIRHIDVNPSGGIGTVSMLPDGRRGLVSAFSGAQSVVDADRASLTPLPSDRRFDLDQTGRFAYERPDSGGQITRVRVSDLTETVFDVPFTNDFFPLAVSQTDASGRYWLLSASSGRRCCSSVRVRQ